MTAMPDPSRSMTDPKTAYENLEQRFKEAAIVSEAVGISEWDMQTVMPRKAADLRGDVLAFLLTTQHKLIANPETGAWLDAAEQAPPSDPWQRRNLELMRRDYRHRTAVPADLVERSAIAAARCHNAWEAEKKKEKRTPGSGSFAAVAPLLKEVVRTQREIANHKAKALGLSLYDALLDQYSPGRKSADIDRLFAPLEQFLPDFITAVEAKQKAEAPLIPMPQVDEDKQRLMVDLICKQMGFDLEAGRIDTSVHPFCGGANADVRLTTRYDVKDPLYAVMGMIHETGHGLYEQGRPEKYLRQPVGQAMGMDVHETQSLIMEMVAARTQAFTGWLVQQLQRLWGADMAFYPDTFHRIVTKVERSFIRTAADEVTYPLHVIMRYRIEKDLIEGKLEVDDLPKRWNADMQRLLHITPPNDMLGCMQDTHWFGGAIGYFPSYTLGAMGATQLAAAAKAQIPFEASLARGDFGPLLAFVRKAVHSQGCLLETDALFAAATGKPLDSEAYIRHVTERYLPGYVAPQPVATVPRASPPSPPPPSKT